MIGVECYVLASVNSGNGILLKGIRVDSMCSFWILAEDRNAGWEETHREMSRLAGYRTFQFLGISKSNRNRISLI